MKRFRRFFNPNFLQNLCQSVHIFHYKSFDIAPNVLYTILFIVNCNQCLRTKQHRLLQQIADDKRKKQHLETTGKQLPMFRRWTICLYKLLSKKLLSVSKLYNIWIFMYIYAAKHRTTHSITPNAQRMCERYTQINNAPTLVIVNSRLPYC